MINVDEDVKICISTCKEYASETIPNVTSSLAHAGVLKDNIYVVEGNAINVNNQYNHKLVDHNSFDLTSLINIVEEEHYSKWWLLIHDTCVVGERFKNCISKANQNVDRVALLPWPSMSIGLYKYEFLMAHKEYLISHKMFTNTAEEKINAKHKAIENEDALLWKLHQGTIDVFGNERITQQVDRTLWNMQLTSNRIQEYFPQLDLYKLKANHGQGGKPIISL